MPRVLIVTEPADTPDTLVTLNERITTNDLDNDHIAGQLIQRMGWALVDADNAERDPIAH